MGANRGSQPEKAGNQVSPQDSGRKEVCRPGEDAPCSCRPHSEDVLGSALKFPAVVTHPSRPGRFLQTKEIHCGCIWSRHKQHLPRSGNTPKGLSCWFVGLGLRSHWAVLRRYSQLSAQC